MSAAGPFDPTEISAPGRSPPRGGPMLSVRDLCVTFRTEAGTVQAVDGVSFDIYPGETLALVGESGSGKSVTALSILRLLDSQRGQVRSGHVYFEGRDLLALSPAEMRGVRGDRIAMVFQDPMSSLNPVFTLGEQLGEPLVLHRGFDAAEARAEAVHLLELVNVPDAERRAGEYPHQLSGGMRQRAMLAMALACRPSLLIADEPTTSLDVTVQAQILELLVRLQAELGMSVLIITHDLGIVATVAQRALVMYAGRVVEQADVLGLFDNPRHPYTAGLFDSLPRLDVGVDLDVGAVRGREGDIPRALDGRALTRLRSIEGSVPDPLDLPSGCRFHPRCRHAFEPCARQVPPLVAPPDAPLGSERRAACWRTAHNPGLSYLAGPTLERTEALGPEELPPGAGEPERQVAAAPETAGDGSRGPS